MKDQTMNDVQIKLSAFWAALMLIYLLGDILRIYAGGFTPGEIGGKKMTQGMGIGIAIFMLIPIVMMLLSLVLGHPVSRWINIIAAISLFIFNLIGLPTYRFTFDKFLIIVGLAINLLTVWIAWKWV